MLGPVLFLIFINDMPLQLQTDPDIYADDTITHTVGKNLEVVEPKLQNSVDDFNTWCIDNNIGIHYGKTHAIKNLTWEQQNRFGLSKTHTYEVTIKIRQSNFFKAIL